MAKEKVDAMLAVLKNIEKSIGNKKNPVLMRYGDKEVATVPCISFGNQDIDDASCCGGAPRGKMLEIFGPESGGKSLLTLKLIASAQKSGMECFLADIEQSFDPKWATKHGVDVNRLVIGSDFDCGEQALDYTLAVCDSGAFGLVVVDSTAALVPKREIDGDIGDATVGELARMMSKACRQIIQACGRTDTTCVFINQIRDKIGIMFGNPETTPGGRALKFYSHQRIKVWPSSRRKLKVDGKEIVVAQISTVKFVKNKVASPFGECKFEIVFNETAANPVVMLLNEAKSAKIISTYKKEFRIDKEPTGCFDMAELADYVIAHNMVTELIDKVEEDIKNDPMDKDNNERVLDEAILEMKTDPSKIVSPNISGTDESKKNDSELETTESEAKQD